MPRDILFEEEDVEVISDSERDALVEIAKNMAKINAGVLAMRGVRRGIVVRAYEKELKKALTNKAA